MKFLKRDVFSLRQDLCVDHQMTCTSVLDDLLTSYMPFETRNRALVRFLNKLPAEVNTLFAMMDIFLYDRGFKSNIVVFSCCNVFYS